MLYLAIIISIFAKTEKCWNVRIRKAAEAAAICLSGEAVHCAADVANHLEIDTAVSILVEDPEDLVDEDLGVAGGENHGVHLQDLVLAQLAVGAVLLEASAMQQPLYYAG